MSKVNVAAMAVLIAVLSYFAYRRIVAAASEPKPISIASFEQLPDGIAVVHESDTVLATLTKPGNKVRSKYTWWFKTTVSAIDGDVQIVEFGVFVRDGRKWVPGSTFTGKPYGSKEFAEWYSCPDATLKVGRAYSDPSNWSSQPELLTDQMRWYFVGIDGTGRRVKGEAIINLKGEVDPNRPRESADSGQPPRCACFVSFPTPLRSLAIDPAFAANSTAGATSSALRVACASTHTAGTPRASATID